MAAKPLALTMGEPAGIGPDITLLAWHQRKLHDVPPFIAVADPAVLEQRAAALGLDVTLDICAPSQAADVFPSALPVAPLKTCIVASMGKAADRNASCVIEAIDTAVRLTFAGETSAVVTNPIAKEPLLRTGFPHPGHTDYLGVLAQKHTGDAARPVMMLWSPALAVVPVTVHIPLADVMHRLTTEAIVGTARIVAKDMMAHFGIASPRLAVCGVNPHAGEGGTLGHEEETIIAPAIAQLQSEGIEATGPYPADTLFHEEARRTYDVALAMYHDQGLIPLKTLAFDTGVNVTLGLPFIRTSPDHGTAFSLAGTGKARPYSLIEALKLANRLSGKEAA